MWLALALAVAMVTTQIVGGAMNEVLINLFPCAALTGLLMLLTGAWRWAGGCCWAVPR